MLCGEIGLTISGKKSFLPTTLPGCPPFRDFLSKTLSGSTDLSRLPFKVLEGGTGDTLFLCEYILRIVRSTDPVSLDLPTLLNYYGVQMDDFIPTILSMSGFCLPVGRRSLNSFLIRLLKNEWTSTSLYSLGFPRGFHWKKAKTLSIRFGFSGNVSLYLESQNTFALEVFSFLVANLGIGVIKAAIAKRLNQWESKIFSDLKYSLSPSSILSSYNIFNTTSAVDREPLVDRARANDPILSRALGELLTLDEFAGLCGLDVPPFQGGGPTKIDNMLISPSESDALLSLILMLLPGLSDPILEKKAKRDRVLRGITLDRESCFHEVTSDLAQRGNLRAHALKQIRALVHRESRRTRRI